MNKKKKILNKITIIVLNFSTKKWSNLLIKLILKMPLHVIIVELIFIIIYDIFCNFLFLGIYQFSFLIIFNNFLIFFNYF